MQAASRKGDTARWRVITKEKKIVMQAASRRGDTERWKISPKKRKSHASSQLERKYSKMKVITKEKKKSHASSQQERRYSKMKSYHQRKEKSHANSQQERRYSKMKSYHQRKEKSYASSQQERRYRQENLKQPGMRLSNQNQPQTIMWSWQKKCWAYCSSLLGHQGTVTAWISQMLPSVSHQPVKWMKEIYQYSQHTHQKVKLYQRKAILPCLVGDIYELYQSHPCIHQE